MKTEDLGLLRSEWCDKTDDDGDDDERMNFNVA